VGTRAFEPIGDIAVTRFEAMGRGKIDIDVNVNDDPTSTCRSRWLRSRPEAALEAPMSELSSPVPASAGSPASEPASPQGSCADNLGLVVAPTTGRFEPVFASGRIRAGQLLGHITGGRGRADEVRSPVDARLKNLLVRPRQLVRRGQALAWLEVSPA